MRDVEDDDDDDDGDNETAASMETTTSRAVLVVAADAIGDDHGVVPVVIVGNKIQLADLVPG